MKCSSCGTNHPLNSNFCCMCGEMLRIPGQEPLKARGKVCSHCGHAVRHSAKFCTQCGYPIVVAIDRFKEPKNSP